MDEKLLISILAREFSLREAQVQAVLQLLDEPYKGLDEATRREAMAFTAQRLKGRTALMITHDLREAEALCRRVLTMRDGRLYEE